MVAREMRPSTLLTEGLSLATAQELRLGAVFLGLIMVGGLIDLVALSAALPFISFLVNPDVMGRYAVVVWLMGLLGNPSTETLVVSLGVICLALVVGAAVFNLFVFRAVVKFGARARSRLARDLLRQIINAPLAWHLSRNSAVTANALQRDIHAWGGEFVIKLLGVARDLLAVILPASLILVTMPLAGLLTLAITGLAIVVLLAAAKPRISRMTEVKQAAGDRSHLYATQALTGIKDVKLSGRGDAFVTAFSREFATISWAIAGTAMWQQFPPTAILLVGQASLFILALVLWATKTDTASLIAQLALLVMVTSRLLPAANRLMAAFTTFYAAAAPISALVDLRRQVTSNTPHLSEGVREQIFRPWQRIALREVDYSYPNAEGFALSSINLTFESRKAYGVVGGSGAGKTTLVDVVAGLLTPSSGTIAVDGLPLDAKSVGSWQVRIGYVTQTPFISDDTLAANVAFGVPATTIDRERVTKCLEAAGLGELLKKVRGGLDAAVGDRGTRLSGGQRQRIAIARSLYDDVDLLILDEATNALDSVTEREVQETIEKLRGEITTIVIAHRLSTVVACDLIIVMDNGRVDAIGSHRDLTATSSKYNRMVEMSSVS